MKQLTFSLFVLFLYSSITFFGQEIIADKGSFGVDDKNSIVVWHVSNIKDFQSKNANTLVFGKRFILKDSSTKNLSYENPIILSNKKDYTLYITKFPLIHLDFDASKINSKDKIEGNFTYFQDNNYQKSIIGIEYRGNISLTFAKKNFDLEFWEDATTQATKDIQFEGLRKDDDWILDALYNEPLRLRSYIATNLWNEMYEPYYLDKEPNAKSGFNVNFVEVFVNNQYYGIYQLMEQVDRKQLQLKKDKNDTIFGEFYIAQSYKGGPEFKTSPEKYNNFLGNWNGWQMKFPLIKGQSNWKKLSDFTDMVVHSSDEEFKQKIEDQFYIKNAIDYYLFVNILGATDNLGKNYSIVKYTKGEPYFFVPWDLDGVWGVIQDGKEQYNTDKILDNGLLKRLIKTNPNNYREKVKNRWNELRSNEWSNEALFTKINNIYNQLSEEKIYEREFLIWKNKFTKIPKEKHYEHLKWWLEKKLNYLDNYFKNL